MKSPTSCGKSWDCGPSLRSTQVSTGGLAEGSGLVDDMLSTRTRQARTARGVPLRHVPG